MTTNEIQTIDGPEVLPAVNLAPAAANPGMSRVQQLAELRAEAEFLQVAMGLAEQACKGQLVAAHFRGKPADGAIAIAYGSSLGWHWTKSLQDVYVVNGKPSIQSKEIRELLIRAGHEIWEEVVGPERVVLAGRRRGSDIVVRVEWTMEKAETAKLTSNPNYQKFPENMLYARCTTDLGKRLAPDALSGLAITEELQEMIDQTPTRVRADRADRGVQGVAAALGIGAEAPNSGGAAEPATEPTPERPEVKVPMITSDQSKKLHALMREHNLDNREEALAWISQTLGRAETDPVTTTKDLTKDEASKIITALDGPEQ